MRLIAFAVVRDRLDVQVEHVDETARGRAVRARVFRVVGKQGVQGIHADHTCPARAPLREQCRQIGEIAYAPVALRTQPVELRRRTPDARVVLHRRRAETARRDDDERRFADRGAVVQDCEAVVTAGRGDRQRVVARNEALAVELDRRGHVQEGSVQCAFAARAGLLCEPPYERRIRVGSREIQTDGPGRDLFAHYQRRRQHGAPAFELGRAYRRVNILRPARAYAQCGEQCGDARVGNFMAITPNIVEIRGDRVDMTQAYQGFTFAHAASSAYATVHAGSAACPPAPVASAAAHIRCPPAAATPASGPAAHTRRRRQTARRPPVRLRTLCPALRASGHRRNPAA